MAAGLKGSRGHDCIRHTRTSTRIHVPWPPLALGADINGRFVTGKFCRAERIPQWLKVSVALPSLCVCDGYWAAGGGGGFAAGYFAFQICATFATPLSGRCAKCTGVEMWQVPPCPMQAHSRWVRDFPQQVRDCVRNKPTSKFSCMKQSGCTPPPWEKRERIIVVVRSPCQENYPADAHPSAHKSVLESAHPRMDSECASGCTWSTARATARLRDGRPPE